MQRRLTIFAISTTAILAIATGIADMFGKSDILCATSACMKVHASSLATTFSVPIGCYAAAFLFLALWLYLKGRDSLSSLILYALLGIEAYFTFFEIFFIGSLCTTCLIFFGLLTACAVMARVNRSKDAILAGSMMFFITHFVFFYPSVTLRPTLTRDVPENKSVEIFASPSCSHCEDAIEELRKACTTTGTPLIVRPVAISKRDVDKSVKWVHGKLFQRGSPTSYRLAEKIVWENEDEVKRLNNGKLAVPLIIIRINGSGETFHGWGKKVKSAIDGLLETTKRLRIGTAETGDVMQRSTFTEQDRSSPSFAPINRMCPGKLDCND